MTVGFAGGAVELFHYLEYPLCPCIEFLNSYIYLLVHSITLQKYTLDWVRAKVVYIAPE